MIVGREEERESGGFQTAAGGGFVERQRDPERCEQVRAPRAARNRTIAVLGDAHTAGCCQQSGARREIEASRGIAARTDDVDERRAGGQLRATRQPAHRAREPAHFVRRNTLAAQRHENCARERRRKLRIGERHEQLVRLRFGEVPMLEQALKRCAQRLRHR
jgi:hypothetical protein